MIRWLGLISGLISGLILLTGTPLFGSSPLFSSDLDKTFREAKRTKKPMMIDFYGIWCPPCNELDEMVFGTPEFVRKSKNFVLLKVDADATTSWKIKDKYKIGGYPTILFLDSKGEEIYRIVGYRSPKEFFRVMDMAVSAKAKPLGKACKSDQEDDLWRCAVGCGERKDTACAEAAYHKLESKLKPGSTRYELARTYFVEHSPNFDLKRDGYERLLTEMPLSPVAIFWASDYLKLFSENEGKKLTPKKELVEKALANYSASLKDARLDEFGVSPSTLMEARATTLAQMGKVEESKKAWAEAAEEFEKLAKALPPGTAGRGFVLERISCLEEAGLSDKALNLAQEYRTKYPNEFTFHYVAASLLKGEKKYAEALPVAEKAFQTGYGDNRIRAAILLIKIYAATPNPAEAKKIYEAVTKDQPPPTSLDVRTHSYLKQLDEEYKKVASVK